MHGLRSDAEVRYMHPPSAEAGTLPRAHRQGPCGLYLPPEPAFPLGEISYADLGNYPKGKSLRTRSLSLLLTAVLTMGQAASRKLAE